MHSSITSLWPMFFSILNKKITIFLPPYQNMTILQKKLPWQGQHKKTKPNKWRESKRGEEERRRRRVFRSSLPFSLSFLLLFFFLKSAAIIKLIECERYQWYSDNGRVRGTEKSDRWAVEKKRYQKNDWTCSKPDDLCWKGHKFSKLSQNECRNLKFNKTVQKGRCK